MMNAQNALNDINGLIANSEVNDAVAEKLLAIAYWLEAELKKDADASPRPRPYMSLPWDRMF